MLRFRTLNRHLRFVVAALLVAGLGGVALWRRHVADEVEATERAGRVASKAMADLNQANEDLVAWFPSAMRDLAGPLVLDPPGASRRISTEVLPKLDAYLATADRALATADAYQERKPDASVESALDTIRRRTAATHELRSTLAGVRDELARGNLSPADHERITSTLSSAGMRLLIAN